MSYNKEMDTILIQTYHKEKDEKKNSKIFMQNQRNVTIEIEALGRSWLRTKAT